MAFFAASKQSQQKRQQEQQNRKRQQQKRLKQKKRVQQQKGHKNKPKHKHMAAESQQDTNTKDSKFTPALPNWEPQVKQYIEQQLKKYQYFKKRPHVYPCDDFEAFVHKTTAILDKKKGDFCWSLDWNPVFFSQLIYNGFLTIASEVQEDIYVMLPKLHEERCVIHLNQALTVSKSTKKKSKNYSVTIDECFEKVFVGCIKQHGLNWLYPPMQAVLYGLYKNRGAPELKGVTAHSIEIWNENGELVAGELGTTVGSIYTSLTGFYLESGTGSIQLLVLGHLLQKCGFLLWDLGMFIEYKSSLGAGLLKRNEFLKKYRSLRDTMVILECKDKMNCRDIVNEVIQKNNATEEKKDIVDEKIVDKGDVEKVLSRKAQKRLAKKEKRRLAKLRVKQAKEQQQNEDTEDTKDAKMRNINNNNDDSVTQKS